MIVVRTRTDAERSTQIRSFASRINLMRHFVRPAEHTY
jgi:hypothetical protein